MKPFALLLCALSAVLLAGCASPTGILPGTPDSVVRSRLGAPDAVHALPDGRRLEYVLGPYQQEVFMVDLSRQRPDGLAVSVPGGIVLLDDGRPRRRSRRGPVRAKRSRSAFSRGRQPARLTGRRETASGR